VIGLDELVRRFAGLERAELTRWIENRWVVPGQPGAGRQGPEQQGPEQQDNQGRWEFHEVDIARVELILEIRREFAVDDEAMALLLGLLDQVYSLRRQMRRLCEAIESQPTDIRDAIRRGLPPNTRTG
jgi:chaperone modulatory protein CbpM